MPTLQRTFTYKGDIKKSPVKEVILKFGCPVFKYLNDDTDIEAQGLSGLRKIVKVNTTDLRQDISSTSYKVEIPASNIIGEDPDSPLFVLGYIAHALLVRVKWMEFDIPLASTPNVDVISLSIHVEFTNEEGDVFGEQRIEVGYFIRRFSELFQKLHENKNIESLGAELQALFFAEIREAIGKNIFFFNRAVYGNLSKELKEATQISDWELLLIISKLVEMRGEGVLSVVPKLQPANLVGIVNEREGIDNAELFARAIEIVDKYYKQLFDFPIEVPEILERALEVGGTFELTGESEITKDDFSNYELTLSWLSGSNFREVHYPLWKNPNGVSQNKLPFSFSEVETIKGLGFKNKVTVSAKDFNDAIVWKNEYHPSDPQLKDLQIKVAVQRPYTLGTGDNKRDSSKKLRGQVIASNKCPLNDNTIIIQAKEEGDAYWQIIGAPKTDKSGYFSTWYPIGNYVAAQAIVSLTPESPVNINIKTNAQGQKFLDEPLFLWIKDADCSKVKDDEEDDCSCHSPKKASRLPDQKDLIASDEYTQDIGGSCINLSTPNRTLNEYSFKAIVRTSDPDIANYTLNKDNGKFSLIVQPGKRERSPITIDNPIHWQDAPDSNENLSIYQSATVATGHILHYRAEFRADGYSLGNLLYSLPLAPGQKKQIVIFDSTHSLQAMETQSMTQREQLAASLTNDRGITDQLAGGINEMMRGSSSASTGGVSAGLGLGAQMGMAGGALGVAGGYASSGSSASQNSSRDISQFFGEKLRQSLMQNAESYRQLNTSVVTTVQEGQRYAATTEVVANHNHCHALTMMYFEVLRHYAIFQELANVEECVFVPLMMTNFTAQNIYKWRDVLAKNLLPMPSSTYLKPAGLFFMIAPQHPLIKAFDANERINTNYANVDFPDKSYDEEKIKFIKGEMSILTNLPRPKTRYDRIKSLPITSKTVTREISDIRVGVKNVAAAVLTGGLSLFADSGTTTTTRTETEEILVREKIFDAYMSLDANYETVPPAQCIRIVNFKPTNIFASGGAGSISARLIDNSKDYLFEDDVVDQQLWSAYAKILGHTGDDAVFKLMNYYFKGRLISEWDEIFYQDMVPGIFKKIVDSIEIEKLSLDKTSDIKYRGGELLMRIQLRGTTALRRKDFPDIIKISSVNESTSDLKDHVTLSVRNLRLSYSTQHYNGVLYDGYVGDDLLDTALLDIPISAEEKRNPREEDKYLQFKLIEHLNSNLEHYNKALWQNLDPDRRYMLLDGFNIQVYNDFGVPQTPRSLASVVKNDVIAIVGNSLVLPVAAGYKVSKTYILEKNAEAEDQQVTLFNHYKPFTPVPPYRISVPSKGVFLEAIQGACDACEKVKENSSQDWTKFKTDEPTAFYPLTAPVPTITDWKPNIKDFATPIVNIQNAPATPEPGAGLAAFTELMGKSGIFKDITGLDANQQNVIRTYLSNQENAKAFAEMAKGLSMQGHNTQNSEKIMDTIKNAKDSGAINQGDYNKLVKEHLQQQIDGGESSRAELETQKMIKPTLSDAAMNAVAQGREVEASKTDEKGNVESIKISGDDKTASLAPGTNDKGMIAEVDDAVEKFKKAFPDQAGGVYVELGKFEAEGKFDIITGRWVELPEKPEQLIKEACYFKRFEKAIFIYNGTYKRVYEVHGMIYQAYKKFGFESDGQPKKSPGLGLPRTDEKNWSLRNGAIIGRKSEFERGTICWRAKDSKVFMQANGHDLFWGIDTDSPFADIASNLLKTTGFTPCFKNIYFRFGVIPEKEKDPESYQINLAANEIHDVFKLSDGLTRIFFVDNRHPLASRDENNQLLGKSNGITLANKACGMAESILNKYKTITTKGDKVYIPGTIPLFGNIESETLINEEFVEGWLEGFASYNEGKAIKFIPGLYLTLFTGSKTQKASTNGARNLKIINSVGESRLLIWQSHPVDDKLNESNIFDHGYQPGQPLINGIWQFHDNDSRVHIDHDLATIGCFNTFWEADLFYF